MGNIKFREPHEHAPCFSRCWPRTDFDPMQARLTVQRRVYIDVLRVLLKISVNTYSMLGSCTIPYDTLLYFEYTHEFTCAYSHVYVGTKTTKLIVWERQKKC